MKFSKVFNTSMLLFSILGNVNSSQVTIDFKSNNEYFVQCKNNSKTFYNIEDFSNGLDSITGEYFGSTPITKNNDIITFNNVNSGNNNQCELLMRNISKGKTRIIINCGNNPIVFKKFIVENIDAMEINSDVQNNKIPMEARTPVKIALNTPDISAVQVISKSVFIQCNSNLADLESVSNNDDYEDQEDDATQSTKLNQDNTWFKYVKCW